MKYGSIGLEQATYEQIRNALYINMKMWKICKKTFRGLSSALKGRQINMALKAQADLQRELYSNPNAKLIEMGLLRYDEGYKPKGDVTTVELPKTLNVTYEDKRKTDKELEVHANKFKD